MVKKRLLAFTGGLVMISLMNNAQVPGSDILIADIAVENRSLSITNVARLTDRQGYDNQPHFLPDGNSLYYTSSLTQGEQVQMDTIRHDFTSGMTVNVTKSATSEYSPTPMPGGDSFSTILVDDAGKQWLWAFDADGKSKGKLLDIEPVGYHAWIDDSAVIMFVLGEPHTLQVADVETGQANTVAGDIGPSLLSIPQSSLMSFTQRQEGGWWLMSYDHENGSTQALIEMPEGVTYYTWLENGTALIASGNTLHQWHVSSEPEWQMVTDLSQTCASGITRLAANRQMSRLALVCNR